MCTFKNDHPLVSEGSRRKSERAGFTLVEVLVSVFLLAIVMGGVFGALRHGFTMTEASRDQVRAGQLMQNVLEDVRTMSWNDLEGEDSLAVITPSDEFLAAYGTRYRVIRTISDRVTNQKEIAVYVLWTDSGGKTRWRQYITWYTEDGLNDYYFRSFS